MRLPHPDGRGGADDVLLTVSLSMIVFEL